MSQNIAAKFGSLALTLVTITALLLFAVGCTPNKANHSPEISSSFEELWSLSDVRTSSNFAGPQGRELFMEISNDQLIYVDTDRPYILKSLTLSTGDSHWESNLSELPEAAIVHSNKVILGGLLATNERPNKDVFCENEWDPDCSVIFLATYTMESGQLLWSNTYSGMALIFQIVADDSTLHLTGSGTKGSFYSELFIDADSGVLQSGQTLKPEDISIPTKLPYQADGVSVKMASAMAYGDTFSAFVANDGMLWVIDAENKSVLATLNFDGPDVTDVAKVIVYGDVIVVYFRDSEQLFAFNFLDQK